MKQGYQVGIAALVSVVLLSATPATGQDVECDGVGWPDGYSPVIESYEVPSLQFGARAAIEFPAHRLPAVDKQKLLDEDEATANWGKPPRVGVNVAVGGPLTGAWHDLPDGRRLWTAAFVTDGAYELRLHFTDVNLPPGGEIYVYSPQDPGQVAGPYVEAGPHQTGEFWAGSVPGDTAYVEYYAPEAEAESVPFAIDEVGHMYRPPDGLRGERSWYHCMVDVPCEPDWPLWEDVSYSVARITFYANDPPDPPAWYICTGTLLATQNNDLTPYFLTGAHCIDEQSEADSVEFRWFYQHSVCGGGMMSSIYRDDADLLGTSGAMSGADWSLLMVKGVLPPNVFWSGWMTSIPASGTWSVCVHHPNNTSDWKRWSRGKRYSGPYANYHEIHYDVAGAEGHIYYGSSGSGIFRESDQKLFGNLSFGLYEPGCDHLSTDAYYGRFGNYYASIASYLAAGSDDAFENNDSCAAAVTLSEGTYSDLVVKSVDEDWYRITLGPNQQVDLDLYFNDAYGNVNAQLFDACDGAVVAQGISYNNNEFLTYVNTGPTNDFYLWVFLYDDTRNEYTMACDISGDGDPPTPDPMSFSTTPYALDQTSIAMEGALATDVNSPPVEYYFEFVSGASGGNDSGWQSEREYTDDGLEPGTTYCYRVKARDSAPVPNETALSSTQCTDTPPIVFGDFDDDGDVDQDDYDAFADCFTGVGGGPVGFDCAAGDSDEDGDVDCEDWDAFVLVWTEPDDPPDFAPCGPGVKRPMPEYCGPRCGADNCVTDADCGHESRCIPGPENWPANTMCYTPKHRYLSIARNSGQTPNTARRIKLDTGELIGWVGQPDYAAPTSQHDGLWLAGLVSSPHYEEQWPVVVHVTGCEIAHASLCDASGNHCHPNECPGPETCVQHYYQIQAIELGQDIGNEGNYSAALVLHTPSTWGDTVSTCAGNVCEPPNGVVGLDDVQAAIKYYQNNRVAPIIWLDIDPSNGSQTPDQNIGIGDILKVIDGFQGQPYPGDGPLGCGP